MERTKWPAICGFVVGTIQLTRSVPTSFALDKPIHTSIVLLASCATAIIAASRFLPKDGGRSHKGQQYDAVPLGEIGQPHSSREPSPSREDVRYPSSLRKLRIVFVLLVLAICLRTETLREIVADSQCASVTWEPLLPFALAVWEYWTVHRHKKLVFHDDPDSSVYDELEEYWLRAPYRYLGAVGVLTLASLLALGTTRSPDSSYICAASLPYGWAVPLIQRLGTLLDIVIVYCVGQLLHMQEGRGARSIALRFMSIGWASLFASVVMLVSSIVYYILQEHQVRKRILTIPSLYFWSVIRLDVLICFTAICTVLTVSTLVIGAVLSS